MQLFKYISQRRGNAPVFITSEQPFVASEVMAKASALREKYAHIQGGEVALKVKSIPCLAFYLIAFDGFVKSLVILSETIGEEPLVSLIESSEADNIIEVNESLCNLESSGSRIVSDIETVWIIPTSGTTDVPKLVCHSLSSLTQTVKKNQSKGEHLRWGLLYDLTRFAGLQVYLQAVIGGSCLILPKHSGGEGVAELFEKAKVNALSATPTMWRKLLMEGSLDKLSLSLITLGGEVADSMVLKELSSRFPESKITHVYASTEAGVGFSVTDKLAGFPAEWEREKLPQGGELKVKDQRLYLRKEGFTTTYLGRDESISDADGWVDTGDLVKLEGTRYLFIGRENGAINVGGQKVQPNEVEQILLSHNQVIQAAVYGKANPFMGNLVVADVVIEAPLQQLKADLLALCKDKLAPYKVPALINFVDQIELTSAGKIKR